MSFKKEAKKIRAIVDRLGEIPFAQVQKEMVRWLLATVSSHILVCSTAHFLYRQRELHKFLSLKNF